ncbi:MAG: GNAT family N-acetyltransferase [Bacilli bacterium]|jgi:ribosomal protein S18 acetylase RimI-like enzyme|nr:GNAT family N-acetyltransferase [Bacilli bacterium]
MIIIRDMIEKDYERKGYIHYKSWLETYKDLMDPRYLEKHSLERCIDIAKKSPKNTLVAEYKNEIVGFAAYNKSSDFEDDRGEVYALYVLKDYQKLGIGKVLMDECIKRLASYKYVSVWVLHNNTKAILWYEKYGFKKDGKARSIPVLNNYQLDELRMTFIL